MQTDIKGNWWGVSTLLDISQDHVVAINSTSFLLTWQFHQSNMLVVFRWLRVFSAACVDGYTGTTHQWEKMCVCVCVTHSGEHGKGVWGQGLQGKWGIKKRGCWVCKLTGRRAGCSVCNDNQTILTFNGPFA